MDEYPPQVEALHAALRSLPAVTEVSSGVDRLDGISAADLALSAYAHLPHAALRRTNGGLPGEMMVQVEFVLEQNEAGWRTLEFLAWFARDQARGGEYLQLRPFALPPIAGDTIQLGHTLRFHLDLFLSAALADPAAGLEKVAEIANGLRLAISIYQQAF